MQLLLLLLRLHRLLRWAQHLKRTGWVRHNVSAPECIAGTPLLSVAAREAELGSRREGSTGGGGGGGGGGTDHMYRMGIMAMLFADSSLNKERMVKLALVHDMAGNPSPPPSNRNRPVRYAGCPPR